MIKTSLCFRIRLKQAIVTTHEIGCINKLIYLLIYALQKNDFPVFGRVWMADEEVRLLEAIEECGIGNWYVTVVTVQWFPTLVYIYPRGTPEVSQGWLKQRL